MSTFSSVIHKPGKKFAPKATPRRNVQRSGVQDAAAGARSGPSSLPHGAVPSTDCERPPSDIGPLHIESSTPPTSVTASASSPASAINTRSTSLETDGSNFNKDPDLTAPAVEAQDRRSHNREPVQNEIAPQAPSDPEVRVSNAQPTHIPAVRSSAAQGVKRKQPDKDVAGNTSSATPTSSTRTDGSRTPSARKRHKNTPQPTAQLASSLAVPLEDVDNAAPVAIGRPTSRPWPKSKSRPPNRGSQQTDALLKNATDQAASVSALADAIDGNTTTCREGPRKRKGARADVESVAETETEPEMQQPRRSKRSRPRVSSIQDAAAVIVAEAIVESGDGSSRRKRRQTPEGAEDHQIEAAKVKMSDLVEDTGLGKKSRREAAMQNIDWDEVKKRRREEALDAQKRREAHEKEKTIASRDTNDVLAEKIVPMMEIGPDGEIMIVEASREVDRQAEAAEMAADQGQVVTEDNAITKRVNQVTIGRPKGVGPGTRWDESMEELFYRGLRMFGTDFMMISRMFPGMTRRHIKLKYVKEEKTNLTRVHENLDLKNREPVNLEEFEKMIDKTFDDPKKVQSQIDAEEKRLRDEDEQRRAREDGEPHPDDDTVLPSREPRSVEPEDRASDREDTADRDGSTTENRFGSIARGIVGAASAPKKKQRKQSGAVKKKDTAAKRGKRPTMEGVEERLGPIDEITR